MKKLIVAVVVLGAAAGGLAYYRYRQTPVPPTIATAAVSRGDIVDRVGATGTLQAVTTVQVGTQVSGTIQSLYADFNSLVRKGQVLARLDPSLFQTQIEQARANLLRAQADVERLRVALDDARTKLTRARELSARQLLPRTELEAAEVAVRSAEAQVRSAEAQVTQAQASLNQNQVNLEHTVIAAPIDGLVISRNVDVGQTVAASMQAPTLFVLAADLTKMQVVANLDESDVGRIRPRQTVRFRVDAYPSDDFTGTVGQVRLQPIVQQNVVTYATVIDVPNPDLKLKPGMTANVNVEIARRAAVLRLPNTALRFRPSTEVFAALGQTPPPGRGGGPGGPSAPASASPDGPAAQSATVTPTAPAADAATPSAPSPPRRARPPSADGSRQAGGIPSEATPDVAEGDRGAGGGRARGRLRERLQGLPPEEREQMIARLRARGFDPSDIVGDAGRTDAPARPTGSRPAAAAATRQPEATTIDALFGPLPTVESIGRVWILDAGQLKPVRVRLGISDGQMTELLEAEGIAEGTELVTNVTLANATTRPAASTLPPFIGAQPGRFGGPGGFGGGGGGATRPGGGGR